MSEKILKIGVIGTGAIGRTHIERINQTLQGGKVVAVSDVNIEFGKSVAEKYGCSFYETGEDLIAAPEVEAIIITTVDEYHERFVMASIAAGKFVFCEKPLSPTAEACKRIVEAEMAGSKRLVQVGFMRRYDPAYRQIKEILDKKTYGEPLMLHCAHRNPDVPEYYTTAMHVENTMIHEIDVLRWLLQEDYESVQVVFPKKTRNSSAELRDPQIMILTTKSGVRIDVEAFVCCKYGYDIRCEVCCEEGILNLAQPQSPTIRSAGSESQEVLMDWSLRFVEAYNIEFQEWINSTLEGRVDGPNSWDGYVGAITATAASKARDLQTVEKIEVAECPAFYK